MAPALYYLLSTLKFGALARRREVQVPYSLATFQLLSQLQRSGFVRGYRRNGRLVLVELVYTENGRSPLTGLRYVSTPGRRVQLPHRDLLRCYGRCEFALISTSSGILTMAQLRRLPRPTGGEVICIYGKN